MLATLHRTQPSIFLQPTKTKRSKYSTEIAGQLCRQRRNEWTEASESSLGGAVKARQARQSELPTIETNGDE